MRHFVRCVIAACLVAGVAHAAPVGAVAAIDRTIVRVGDAVIWQSDVAARVKSGTPEPDVIDAMIDDELVFAEGRKAGITADKTEVLAAYEEIKTQNKLDDAGLEAALKEAGYTKARYLVDLERQLILLRTKNQLLAPKIFIEDSAVDAEVKTRKLPPTAENKDTVRTELRRKALAEQEVVWVKELRKHALIARRP
jgi:parvulin-like peptidyl-prolyl isomerase